MNFKKLGWFVEGSIFSLIDNYLIFIKRKIYVYLDIYFNKKWNSSPLLKAPLKNKDYYNKLHHEEKNNQYSTIDKYENKSGYCIDKEWFEDLAFKTQVVIKKSPICYQHGRILYSTLSEYIHSNNFENINILETGTAAGFSSLCMAKALDDYLVNGRIHTFDILPHNKKMFWNRVSDHSGQSSRRELLQSWQKLTDKYIYYYQGDSAITLPKVHIGRINFAFIDAFHTYNDVINEFNSIKDYQEKGDLIVFDDYTPKQYIGLVDAVDWICENYDYKMKKIYSHDRRGYVVAKKHK